MVCLRSLTTSWNYAAYSTISELAFMMAAAPAIVYALAGRKNIPRHPRYAPFLWFTKANEFIGCPLRRKLKSRFSRQLSRSLKNYRRRHVPAHPAEQMTCGYADCWSCTPRRTKRRQCAARVGNLKRVDPALAKYVSPRQDSCSDRV